MEFTASLVAYVVGSLIILRWLSQLLFNYVRYSYPPGPRQWPILGSFTHLNRNQLHIAMFDHREKYGDISHVKLFESHIVVINLIAVWREAMLEPDYKNIFSGRMTTLIFKQVVPDDLIFNPYDDKWARLRKLVHNTITPYANDSNRIEDTITSEIQTLKYELELKVKNPFDIYECVVKTVGNIMYILIMGERFDYDHQIHEYSRQIFGNIASQRSFNALIVTLFPGLLVPPEHPNRRNLAAFGLGNRRCIGDVFARNRLFLFVTHLYQKFDIYHDHMETVPSMNPRDFAAETFIAPRRYELQLAVRASGNTSGDNH